MVRKTVGVLFGGCSSEYEVSLRSAASVIQALCGKKYAVVMVGITRDGRWLRYLGDPNRIATDEWRGSRECVRATLSPSRDVCGLIEFYRDEIRTTKLDVVIPMLHGRNGEDGSVQGLLELSGIPYVGCGLLSSALCMDKAIAHALVQRAGIEVPHSVVLRKGDAIAKKIPQMEALGYPLIVKPANAGSSIGVTKAGDPAALLWGIEQAFAWDDKAIVEETIRGREIGCAILGNRELHVGAMDSMELKEQLLDYEQKYGASHVQVDLPAALEPAMERKIRDTACSVYRALECEGLARVDLFLTPEQRIVFNEVNTMPGFTAVSRYPQMMRAAGWSMEALLDAAITSALEDKP